MLFRSVIKISPNISEPKLFLLRLLWKIWIPSYPLCFSVRTQTLRNQDWPLYQWIKRYFIDCKNICKELRLWREDMLMFFSSSIFFFQLYPDYNFREDNQITWLLQQRRRGPWTLNLEFIEILKLISTITNL